MRKIRRSIIKTCKAELQLFSGLFIGLILTILLGSCSSVSPTSSRPSDADVRKAIEEEIESAINIWGNKLVKLVHFEKTDGVEGEAFGIKFYNVNFDATVECLTDCYYWGPGVSFRFEKEFQPGPLPSPNIPCAQGQQVTLKGGTSLIKTERGWHRRGDN